MSNDNSIEDVLKQFNEFQLVSLATNDKNQPRVRPVMLVKFEDKFFVSSSTNKAYVEQILENPKIGFCLMLGDITRDPNSVGCVRATCNATEVKDKDYKTKVYNKIDFLKMFNKTLDDYLASSILFEFEPTSIKYMAPGTWQTKDIPL